MPDSERGADASRLGYKMGLTMLHLVAVAIVVGIVACKAGPVGVGITTGVGLFIDRLFFNSLWPYGHYRVKTGRRPEGVREEPQRSQFRGVRRY